MATPLTFDPTANLPSFSAAAARFRDGLETPREFLERCLERIAAYEPAIHAFAWFDPAGPRAAATRVVASAAAGNTSAQPSHGSGEER